MVVYNPFPFNASFTDPQVTPGVAQQHGELGCTFPVVNFLLYSNIAQMIINAVSGSNIKNSNIKGNVAMRNCSKQQATP